MNIQGHRRTRSLDMGDSLGWMEARQQSRQQLIENTAKFSRTRPLPPLKKPQRVKSLSVSHSGKNGAGSTLISTAKFISPTDEIDAADASSSTTKTSSAFASDKFHAANASPLTDQKSRPTTPISKLIQQFTSEILNSEMPHPKPQSQSSVKESLIFQATDDTHTSWRSTADSGTQSSIVFSSVFQSDTIMHNSRKPTATAVPFKPPNLVQSAKTSVQQPNTESNGVTLRRPSYFWTCTNSSEPTSQLSSITDAGTVTSNRAASLLLPQTYNTDSAALGTISHTPLLARKVQITEAVPFRPPEWVKLPVTSVDQTDVGPSWIQVSSSSAVKVAGCPSQPSSVVQPHLTRASSFCSYSVTERSIPCVSPTSTEGFTGKTIQHNEALDTASPCKTRTYVSKWESLNKPEQSNSNSHSQIVRRSSTSSLTSFPRRSQMPSIPVKSLVKKFLANN
jgi:hypothetical protein